MGGEQVARGIAEFAGQFAAHPVATSREPGAMTPSRAFVRAVHRAVTRAVIIARPRAAQSSTSAGVKGRALPGRTSYATRASTCGIASESSSYGIAFHTRVNSSASIPTIIEPTSPSMVIGTRLLSLQHARPLGARSSRRPSAGSWSNASRPSARMDHRSRPPGWTEGLAQLRKDAR